MIDRTESVAGLEDVYQCPESGEPLRVDGTTATTPDGKRGFAVHEGCIDFLSQAYSENARELGTVQRALGRVREVGWRGAIDEAYGPGTPGHRYITESGRARFIDFLGLGPEDVVLEIGCSMGQHTTELAARCGRVYGIDVILDQAVFTRIRCEQEGLRNVSVCCGGDRGVLPYRAETFTVVLFNLVLEWCGARGDEPHQAIQERLLREAHRVLKPGGRVFINTKNRYSTANLLGGRDDHTAQLRCGNALPRAVTAAILRRRGVRKTPGWLHSFNGLQTLVARAGFGRVESYWAAPDMRYPKEYVPTDTASMRRAWRERGSEFAPGRKQKAMMSVLPAGLLKFVTPGLCVVGHKSS